MRNVSKKSLFHSTARTRILGAGILIGFMVILALIPLTSMAVERITPDLISLPAGLQEELGIRIDIESVSTDILRAVTITGITVHDRSGAQIASVETLVFNHSVFTFLPRYVFSVPLDITLSNVDVSVTPLFEEQILAILETGRAPDSGSGPDLGGRVRIDSLDIVWDGSLVSGSAFLPSFSVSFNKGSLKEYTAFIDRFEAASGDIQVSGTDSRVKGSTSESGVMANSFSAELVSGSWADVIPSIKVDTVKGIYSSEGSVSIDTDGITFSYAVPNGESGSFTSALSRWEGAYSTRSGLSGSVLLTSGTLSYGTYLLQSDRFLLRGEENPGELSLSLTPDAVITSEGETLLQLGSTYLSFAADKTYYSLYLQSEHLHSGHPFFMERIEGVSLSSVNADNPSVYARYHREDGEITWEAQGSLSATMTAPYETSVSADLFGNGTLGESGTIEAVDVYGEQVNVSLHNDPFSLSFAFRNDTLSPNFSVRMANGEELEIIYQRNLGEGEQTLTLKGEDVFPETYSRIISLFSPELNTMWRDSTNFTGELRGSFTDSLSRFDINAYAAVTDLVVGDILMNGAATLLAEGAEDRISIPSSTITTEGIRVSFSGEIDRSTLFPRGVLEMIQVTTGKRYAKADFNQSGQGVFGYSITSSLVPSATVSGTLRRVGGGLIAATGDARVFDTQYPYLASIDAESQTLKASMPNLILQLQLLNRMSSLEGSIDTSGFILPDNLSLQKDSPLHLDGRLEGTYDFTNGSFTLASPDLSISNIAFAEVDEAVLSIPFTAENTGFFSEELLYSDRYDTLRGAAIIRLKHDIITSPSILDNIRLHMNLSSDSQVLEATILPPQTTDEHSTVSLTFEGFPLSRILSQGEGWTGNFTFTGSTDWKLIADGEGRIEITDADAQTEFTTLLSLTEEGIAFSEGSYMKGNMTFNRLSASYSYAGNARFYGEFSNPMTMKHRDATTRATVELFTDLGMSSSLFTAIPRITSLKAGIPDLNIRLTDASLLNMLDIPDSEHLVTYHNSILEIAPAGEGFLDLLYDMTTGALTIETDESFLFPMKGEGSFSRNFISLDLSYLEFDFTYLNAVFPEPSVLFHSGLMSGSVLIEGDPKNPGYWGMMSGKDVSVSLFWLPDTVLKVENPFVSLDDHTFTIPFTSTSSHSTGAEPASGEFSMEADFRNWNLDSYSMSARIEEGTIPVYIPVTNIDMLITGEVNGTFGMEGTLSEETIYGDIYAPQADISFGIPQLPSWYIPKTRTSTYFDFTSGRNVNFVYPNAESPIVSATVQDNQKISFGLKAPEMTYSFSGDIGLRSGEIYYVQENFYITEGSVVFPSSTGLSVEELLPRVNLRARLRKFDTAGDRIDIYLILQNSLLTSIQPRFESIPARSDNEILQLLGQNLLRSNFSSQSDEGFQSVLNAATAATDMISRLGLIEGASVSFGFSSVIRDAFGLDVFTIRSNLLQNILLDAIPGAADNTNVSPFGRYLDNTTLYLGKYLADQLYLQGLISFRRDTTGVRSSFLAPDLTLDTELSIEWLNQLATFSFFTQPNELSLFNIFDTMGFSVTKSIEF